MKHDTRSPAHSFLKVFLCSPALSLDHSGFASRRHLGFLSLPHPSLLDQRLNPLWIRPRNAYANTERERQCLHYLAHSLSLVHISPFMQPISDSMHMEISAVRKPAVLCQDPPPSLMRLHPSWPALPIPLPSGDKSPRSALSLRVAANELFLASSLVAATCECRSPLARAGVATSLEYSRLWRWRRSQWHSERARLISRHTWCDRERRGGEGDPADYRPQRRLPFLLSLLALFQKEFQFERTTRGGGGESPASPPCSSPHSAIQSKLT